MSIRDLFRERILVLDGAMGTMLQRHRLVEKDYRGDRFVGHPKDLKGNHDLLSLTRPEVLLEIHRSYLEAGADILETNTFNANSISQADYGLTGSCREMNLAAARIARKAVAEFGGDGKPRFVAGAIGPTNKTASLSPNVEDPAFRAVTFDDLAAAYEEQARALIEGGVDLLLIETVFDTLNAKAALFAVEEAFDALGIRLPLLLSVTLSDASRRTLSGQTLEAFLISVAHADLTAIGLNCSLGPREMLPPLKELAAKTPLPVAAYPNAGLPNSLGEYEESAESMAEEIREFLSLGLVNVVGGCCGTTPAHIAAIAREAARFRPRVPPSPIPFTRLAGLEPLALRPESNFINIGERTNVMGSKRFARMIADGKSGEALRVAREQVEGGAQILDICMDEGMLDAEREMTRFLRLLGSEPDVARVPVMIDSSRWPVIEAGLKCVQGKPIVNSISLKEGEEIFRTRARKIRRYGAAAVVMAFDERGQASTFERKVEVARRAHRILIEELRFPAEDLIFDPNILAVATGIPEHDSFAVETLRAIRWIKENLPGVKVSGGVSNLSFAFRGHETVRRAMHSVFLYHAVRAGIDMGIVNPAQLDLYDDIPEELRARVEDVILNRRPDATERLVAFAKTLHDEEPAARQTQETWRNLPVGERLSHALIHGIPDWIEPDVGEALKEYPRPLEIIEGPLMEGMKRVGESFGAGKMFLPQVVKSARVMKQAVALVTPYLPKDRSGTAAKVLLATVKGDVHDIGKNIVRVVLECNGFDVIDLGIMVPADAILAALSERKPDIVGLSGLITPSLEEMVAVAGEMERQGFSVPLLVGGATTSETHTAVKIAPNYSGPTVHVRDASQSPAVVSRLLSREQRGPFGEEIRRRQEETRRRHSSPERREAYLPIDEARENRLAIDWTSEPIREPASPGVHRFPDLPLAELERRIDWTFFFHAWKLNGTYPAVLSHPEKGNEARKLHADAETMLAEIRERKMLTACGVVGIFPANSEGDDVVIYSDVDRRNALSRFHFLRDQRRKPPGEPNLSWADFVAPRESGRRDHLGLFLATAGLGLDRWVGEFRSRGDDYRALLLGTLADRLAEAAAEYLHEKVRGPLWGFPSGVRPAVGYPSIPDHSEKQTLFRLLDPEGTTSITLTETCAMQPAASVCGFYLANARSRYFDLGKILPDQLEEYARRKGIGKDVAGRWLSDRVISGV